jgi:hypothetical protein
MKYIFIGLILVVLVACTPMEDEDFNYYDTSPPIEFNEPDDINKEISDYHTMAENEEDIDIVEAVVEEASIEPEIIPPIQYTATPPNDCAPVRIEPFNPNRFTKPWSTNVLYPDLIIPCDDSDFLYITPVSQNDAYYMFIAHFPNDIIFAIQVDTAFTYEEAIQTATAYGYTFGQIPFLLRHNFERLILKPGNGHPYSGQEIKTYTELGLTFMGFKEENLMHDLAHASLNSGQGLLSHQSWKTAMREDGYYPSLYAKTYYAPYKEDAPEVIIYYLVSRWRPERFDPKLVEFINNRFPHRFAILDELDWNFHN